jgi:hypothetical protein
MAYKGPRRIKAKYAFTCPECGNRYPAGSLGVWFPTLRVMTCTADVCQDKVNRRALRAQAEEEGR